jgi:hypothetical protein
VGVAAPNSSSLTTTISLGTQGWLSVLLRLVSEVLSHEIDNVLVLLILFSFFFGGELLRLLGSAIKNTSLRPMHLRTPF